MHGVLRKAVVRQLGLFLINSDQRFWSIVPKLAAGRWRLTALIEPSVSRSSNEETAEQGAAGQREGRLLSYQLQLQFEHNPLRSCSPTPLPCQSLIVRKSNESCSHHPSTLFQPRSGALFFEYPFWTRWLEGDSMVALAILWRCRISPHIYGQSVRR